MNRRKNFVGAASELKAEDSSSKNRSPSPSKELDNVQVNSKIDVKRRPVEGEGSSKKVAKKKDDSSDEEEEEEDEDEDDEYGPQSQTAPSN
jgi:hypothetical protein